MIMPVNKRMLLQYIGVSFTLLILATGMLGLAMICPKSCLCSTGLDHDPLALTEESAVVRLTIDCRNRTTGQNLAVESLDEEINEVLSGINNLMFLNITNSKLRRVPSKICTKVGLQELYLDGNNLKNLPNDCFNRLSNLRVLTANGNRLSSLQDGLLLGLQHLTSLSFANNIITTIGINIFSNSSDLLSLTSVNLEYNELTTLDLWPITRVRVTGNFYLKLDHNKIQRTTNDLGVRFNCLLMPQSQLTISAMSNRIAHFIDLIDAFNVDRIVDIMCMFSRGHSIPFTVYLNGNPLVCDCLDFSIYKFCRFFAHSCAQLQDVFCKDPTILLDSKIIAVPLSNLICKVVENCPDNCTCVNQPSETLFHVKCPASALTNLPNEIPSLNTPKSLLLQRAKKYKLDFSHNRIDELRDRPYFNTTMYIDLSSSHLKSVSVEALMGLKNVETILLHDNLLTTLPPKIATLNLSFSLMSIYSNPLSCDCEQVWLQIWLISVKDRLDNPDGILCASPDWLNGKNLLLADSTEFCTNPNFESQRKTIIAFSSGFIVLCFVIAIGVCIARKCRYIIFRRFAVHPFDRDECDGEGKEYDVFLAYSNEDKNFAHEVIDFLMENFCKVLYHEEHFIFGSSLPDNVRIALKISKRVLCIVSQNFIDSRNCLMEFREAYNQRKRNRLIVMKMLPFPFNSSDHEVHDEEIHNQEVHEEEVHGMQIDINLLEEYSRSHTHISWQIDTWKERVLYAMPIRRMGNDNHLLNVPLNEPMISSLNVQISEQINETQNEPLIERLNVQMNEQVIEAEDEPLIEVLNVEVNTQRIEPDDDPLIEILNEEVRELNRE